MSTIEFPLNLIEKPPGQLFPLAMSPHVIQVEKRGPILISAPEIGEKDVLGLDLTRGCYQRCAFCAVRGSPAYSGDEVVAVYRNAAERLAAELDERDRPPRAVFISPHMDPFPPESQIQSVTAQVVEVLAERGVEAWLMTRGWIRPAILDALEAQRRFVKVMIPITTLQRDLQRALEKWTASPRLRLRQIRELRRREIAVQVALEPLLPDVTDTTENLDPLLRALAEVGVQRVTASYLFLREGVQKNLAKALGEETAAMLQEVYEGGPYLAPVGQAAARFLPRARRQRGYANLMALAANYGITVSISRLSNPDFGRIPASHRDPSRKALLPRFLEGKSPTHVQEN